MNVEASAEDNEGVVAVRFAVDGQALGSEDTEPPYSIQWSTLDRANGEHTLTAVARDAAGNTAASAPVVVSVQNGPPPTGSVRVSTTTSGTHPDPDGYSVTVAGRQFAIGNSETSTVSDVSIGTYNAVLNGVAANCTVNTASRWVTVVADGIVDVQWEINCPIPVGQIIFTFMDYGPYDMYLIGTDGSGLQQVTQTGAPEVSPSWSPDGFKVAFSRLVSTWQIVVRSMTGTEVQLTNDGAHNEMPAWSRDGSKIAFARGMSGDYEIYVMNANGTGAVNLSNHPEYDWEPAWSPDGTKIAFCSVRDGNWEIYVMNSDGSNVTRLTETLGAESGPAWSPDGTRILFASARDGNQDLYLMDPDGSNVTRLTTHPDTERDPTWEPSGERIVFVRQGSFQDDLWVMDANGANQTAITNSIVTEAQPAWRP